MFDLCVCENSTICSSIKSTANHHFSTKQPHKALSQKLDKQYLTSNFILQAGAGEYQLFCIYKFNSTRDRTQVLKCHKTDT